MENYERTRISASDKQGGDKYPGIDNYDSTLLKRGSKICALVAYYETGVMKPCEFYFPLEAIEQSCHNAKKLSQGLQISPWKNYATQQYSYKNRVATFVVLKDINVEFSSKVSENSCYGEGGIAQYHIPQEVAAKALKKEDSDTFLDDAEITEDEYDLIMDRKDQILIKRNLFSYLKSKVNTLDILQNTSNRTIEEQSKRNLQTINQHIENLMIDLAVSQEQIGDVTSDKYDRNINILLEEIEIREQDDTLLISNVKLNKEINDLSQTLEEKIDFNIISYEQDQSEIIAKNISQKIEKYEQIKENGLKPEIDVEKQNLLDVLNINKFNKEGKKSLAGNPPKETNYLSIRRLIMQHKDGSKEEIKLVDFFTESSIKAIQNTRNGDLTPTLQHKTTGTICKLLMVGNKPHLYIAQDMEKLCQTLERLQLDETQKNRLWNGGEIELNHIHYHIDRELNALVPPNTYNKQLLSKKASNKPTAHSLRH